MDSLNDRIAREIWHNSLQNSIDPFKWKTDFLSVKSIDRGTAFKVYAPFLDGWVNIQLENDDRSFKVSIKPTTFLNELTFRNITSDKLVSTISRVLLEGVICENAIPDSIQVAV